MKNFKIIGQLILLLSAGFFRAQFSIGKPAVQGSSILDFGTNMTQGIILPATSGFPVSPTNGTFIFNRNDARIYTFQKNAWLPLTEGNGSTAAIINNPSPDVGNGVIIGAPTSPATGVLVLESSSLALTLPKINQPHLTVKSPYPGMMCYDTDSNTVAFFDGAYWNFWR